MSSRASARRLVTILTSPLAGGVALAALVSSAAVVNGGTPSAAPAVQASPRTSIQSLQVPQLPQAAPGNARAAATQVLANLEAPTTSPYSMVGVTWPLHQDVEGVEVQVRARGTKGWSDWTALHFDSDHQDHGDHGDHGEAVRGGTDPFWVGESRGVQVRVEGPVGTSVKDLRVELVQPAKTSQLAPMAANTDLTPMPSIITRRQWGADESLGDSCWDPIAPTVKAIFVHHTVGTNSYAKDQSDDLVRGIHAYHTRSQGWCDIGYNFLIDRYGQTFEGRAGGILLPIRGSHAGEVNSGTSGVSLMGNFQEVSPPWAMQQALVNLAAWQLESRYRDPRGTTLINGRRYDVVSGHRDAMSTACPGEMTYRMLPALRDRIATRMGDVRSANWSRWQRLGGEDGPLGSPYIGERPVGDGRVTDFQTGSVYWSSATGAREVTGGIRVAYRRAGGSSGHLGFPVTGELDAGLGDDARFNSFQRGGIYWSKETGAHSVFGGINAHYHRLGGAAGIGLPLTDELDAGVPGGRFNSFQRGGIYWSKETGTHGVYGGINALYNRVGGAVAMGLPTADEADAGVPGSRVSTFQRGHVYWSRATGPRGVLGAILSTYLHNGGSGSRLGLPTTNEYSADGVRRQDFQGGSLTWDPNTRRTRLTYSDN